MKRYYAMCSFIMRKSLKMFLFVSFICLFVCLSVCLFGVFKRDYVFKVKSSNAHSQQKLHAMFSLESKFRFTNFLAMNVFDEATSP